MKHNIYLVAACLCLAACASKSNKAKPIDTKITSSQTVTGGEKVGVNKDGDMVVMDKQRISEKLRDLQNDVYSLEDQVYGMRKFHSEGLYGKLKSCLRKLSSHQYGGSGTLVWTEPLDRVTDKEDEYKVGLGDQKQLVSVTEEFLKDRLSRFEGYKHILEKRQDDFQNRTEDCKAQLAQRKYDASQSSRVVVTEASKAQMSKVDLNNYMCQFVKDGASLQKFMMNAFANGWLSLSDFKMDQNIEVNGLSDSKGDKMDHGFMFHGWKLAFDKGPLTMADVLSDGKDAHLVAWTYSPKTDVKDSGQCLKSDPGAWNK